MSQAPFEYIVASGAVTEMAGAVVSRLSGTDTVAVPPWLVASHVGFA